MTKSDAALDGRTPSARRLLLVHAHPDDESIGTGATMARYAAEGAQVTLVTCTLGELGEVIPAELAHLARDVAYALEASEDLLPFRLKLWLTSAFALANSVTSLAASTLAAKRRTLRRSLADILTAPTSCDLARIIQNRFRRARDQQPA